MPKTGPFEKHSKRYDEWFEKNRAAYHAELEAIREMIPSPRANGLEVGVGSGRFAAPLGIKIGVDPSEKMAAKAEKRGIRVFRETAERLPFADCEFDYVLLAATICFVDDLFQSFREAFRVLKPGGCIIVGFINRESELGRQYRKKRDTNVFYREAVFFSTQQVRTVLAEAGFGNFTFKQTLISGEARETVRDGLGKGAFIVIKGVKRK